MAAVLNTDSIEPGEEGGTREETIAITQMRDGGGSAHHGNGGVEREYQLLDIF